MECIFLWVFSLLHFFSPTPSPTLKQQTEKGADCLCPTLPVTYPPGWRVTGHCSLGSPGMGRESQALDGVHGLPLFFLSISRFSLAKPAVCTWTSLSLSSHTLPGQRPRWHGPLLGSVLCCRQPVGTGWGWGGHQFPKHRTVLWLHLAIYLG